MTRALRNFLKSRQSADGYFESRLSDSAISTSVACVALEMADAQKYANEIASARKWLLENADSEGLYGDSPESPPNLTATFLAYVTLSRDETCRTKSRRAEVWLRQRFGDFSFPAVRRGLLAEYGKDLTFSVPLLALATTAGFFPDAPKAWRQMPPFPLEVVLLPENLFKYLNLPVVSYAIPALISVGLAQWNHTRHGIFRTLRGLARRKALRVLEAKQPADGGFLEASPLTGFCLLCLVAAGQGEHPTTTRAADFLVKTQRKNGSWPIDVDLRQWVTSLALAALAPGLGEEEKRRYREMLRNSQTRNVHPFTRSAPGGWGWTTHSGSVPDADDTSAALVALHALGEEVSETVTAGIGWLLDLQNADGGIPTFCRGWGKLPFDRSCPDISAHAFRAMSVYEKGLDAPLKKRVARSKVRILRYLEQVQREDGAFLPLWFGDQETASQEAPVYGSAVVLANLHGVDAPFLEKTRRFLLSAQHETGGWGSWPGERDYVAVTARCVTALAPYSEAFSSVRRAKTFLRPFAENPETIPPEPFGLYFAHLWYSEELYAPIFLGNVFGEEGGRDDG
ncbi:MAG: prenyltransferase/squalene oxidase repeat-containing protein [Planctomycetia bacterium]|nr:prenyltransferase/squalene oxidase repeat-containing protein [Planctomycetia bacterium]